MTQQIEKYYSSFLQDVTARQLANEDGDTQEQAFTRYVLDILSEAGETENAAVAFDERALGTKNQHKINGYAIADNYETVDLFISIFEPEETIHNVYKSEVDRAATRISNFFRKAVYGDYANEVEESSEIFEFASTLGSYQELKENLVRVNANIITNAKYDGDIPESIEISGYMVFFRVIDIKHLYQISEEARVPIEINLKNDGFNVACLAAPSENSDYQAYIAIIPGLCLAKLYEQYGARLLEQNVRSFLQFTGKINKGIRDTIKKEPHMFLAFNNGLAATADNIILDETGHFIEKISNLQIVNGGQTTASIYHTFKKDKADISQIYVQAKISVIKRKEEYSDIVSRISRYANTQNKVNDADFTANNPYLVAFEKLSRFVLTPVNARCIYQTNWFFERARGQYKNLRQKEGFNKSRQAAFDMKYPKSQMFTKVELAKYVNAYSEVYDGKKLAIGPHIVVRGNEKNFAKFINENLPSSISKVDNIYFEDTIAKAILFKTADKLYGTKRDANCIGELKQVVVPYTISLLTYLTQGKLDLYKIWKEQAVSKELSDFLYILMKQVNNFILTQSPITHFIEWSKKEDCWLKAKEYRWRVELQDIKNDLMDTRKKVTRKIVSFNNTEELDAEKELAFIKSIPYQTWKKIAEWGKDSDCLSINAQTIASEIAHKLRFGHKLTAPERRRGIEIFDIVCEKNIELLQDADGDDIETVQALYDSMTTTLKEPEAVYVTVRQNSGAPEKVGDDVEVYIADYSDLSIVVYGDTKPYLNKLKEAGGRYNPNLRCGPGWIFPKKKEDQVRALFGLVDTEVTEAEAETSENTSVVEAATPKAQAEITLDLIRRMADWDAKKHFLGAKDWRVLSHLGQERYLLTPGLVNRVRACLQILEENGFEA